MDSYNTYPQQPPQPPKQPPQPKMTKCPKCHRMVLKGEQYCPYCGAELKRFYEKLWFTILSLICIPPLGIFFLWYYQRKTLNKVALVILTIVFVAYTPSWIENVVLETPEQTEIQQEQETEETENQSSSQTTKDDIYNPNKITVANYQDKSTEEYLYDFIEGVEPYTSKMIDVISRAARNSANYMATTAKREEALNFIKNNYPNYWTNEDTLIKSIYYGYYLSYAFDNSSVYSNLGFDVYEIGKAIYRQEEVPESDFVQNNLRKIQENINKLND